MRGEDPRTGRRRLASRAGLTRETGTPIAGAGVPVQALLVEPYSQPADDFVQLGFEDGGSGLDLLTEWERRSPYGDAEWDVWVNSQRDSYWLTDSGLIVKRNRDGEQVWRQALPLRNTDNVARRFAVSPLGDVYAAASTQNSSFFARIWKLEPRDDDKGMTLAWSLDLPVNEITDIEFDAGRLVVAGNDSGNRRGQIFFIENAVDGIGFVAAKQDAAYPINAIAVGPLGLYATFLPDPGRGPGGVSTGYMPGTEDIWSPFDLPDASSSLFAWLRASEVGTFADGGEVTLMNDVRFLGDVDITDDIDRSWTLSRFHHFHGSEMRGNQPCRFYSQGAGPNAGLLFDPTWGDKDSHALWSWDNGAGMSSRLNGLADTGIGFRADKISTASKLPGSKGLWPLTYTHTFSQHWLVRWSPGALPGVLWHVGGADFNVPNPNYLAIVMNYGEGDSPPPGFESPAYQENWHEQVGLYPQADGQIALIRGTPDGPDVLCLGKAGDHDGSNLHYALITIVKNSDGKGFLRVNGLTWFEFVGLGDPENSIPDTTLGTHSEVIGNRVHYEGDVSTNRFLSWVDSWKGTFVEAVTIMGESSDGEHPHDIEIDDFTVPNRVTLTEGYLAHRYGIAGHVLHASHIYASTPPSGAGAPGGSDQTSIAAAFKSKDGILAKFSSGIGEFQWAITGAGLGYDVQAGPDGEVFFSGPRLLPLDSGVPLEDGPRARILGKALDRGLRVESLQESRGLIRITAVPAHGEAFFLHDGVRSVWVEFVDGVGSPHAGTLTVDVGGFTNLQSVAAALQAAIVLADPAIINVWAERHSAAEDLVQDIGFYSREAPDEVEHTIITDDAGGTGSTPATSFSVAFGMDGGEDSDLAWNTQVIGVKGLTNPNMRMAVDIDGNLHVPLANFEKSNHYQKRRGSDGLELFTHQVGGVGEWDVNAVALELGTQDFQPDATGPEFAWLATGNTDATDALIDDHQTEYMLRLVRRDTQQRLPYLTCRLAISRGKLYRWTVGGSATQVGAGTPFNPESEHYLATALYGEVFLSDGRTRKVYNCRKDTLRDWLVVGSGEIPVGFRILETWNDRLVMAHFAGDPHLIQMSARGEPYNHHLFPPQPNAGQAWAGTLQLGPYRKPDPINGFVPIADDLAIVGGQRSLHRMTGDPAAGGTLDLFSDTLGMAFGRAWTALPGGRIMFVGLPSGIWIATADGALREITLGKIERRLDAVDQSKFRFRLAYSEAEHGVYVFLLRIQGQKLVHADHWFYDLEREAWWPDRLAIKEYQPASVALDGRTILIGSEDGWVRRVDLQNGIDDQYAFRALVRVGPVISNAYPEEGRFMDLTLVTGKDNGPVEVSLYGGETDEDLESPLERGHMDQGLSEPFPEIVATPSFTFEVGSVDGPFALESASVSIAQGARKQRR